MANVTIPQALQYVADHPVPATDAPIEMPVWELVSRALFQIANSPDAKVAGSMTRATAAQKIIFNRLVGLRRPGSHPAARKAEGIDFVDLTAGAVEA